MTTEQKLRSALQEIRDLHPEDLDGQVYDEWGEAACFQRCKQIASEVLDEVEESTDAETRFTAAYALNP